MALPALRHFAVSRVAPGAEALVKQLDASLVRLHERDDHVRIRAQRRVRAARGGLGVVETNETMLRPAGHPPDTVQRYGVHIDVP